LYSGGGRSSGAQGPEFIREFADAWPAAARRSPTLRQALLEDDLAIVHHHALWLPTLGYAHQAARRHGCPLVVSPRGMLSRYAVARSKARKRLARWFVHPGAMQQAAAWHATSTDEHDDIRRAGFRQPIVVAPNGIDVPIWNGQADREAWLARCLSLRGKRTLLFFSRLHSKKGIGLLLEMWKALAPRFADWHLLVCGTADEFDIDTIRQLIENLQIGDRATAASPDGLAKPYPLAELYVLPTASENFGLTVGESLASGVPVLVSDQAPWQGMNDLGCGRCVPLAEFHAALAELLSLSPDKLRAMGAIGRDYVVQSFSWQQQAQTLLDFYATLAS
jgi:glycosyltransferase involved in cell wall biosynthesis